MKELALQKKKKIFFFWTNTAFFFLSMEGWICYGIWELPQYALVLIGCHFPYLTNVTLKMESKDKEYKYDKAAAYSMLSFL